jgi:hypothetical protein
MSEASTFAAWPTPGERPRPIASLLMPLRSGSSETEASPETGASRSALIRNLPERVVSAPAFLGLILAGMIAGACVGALIGRGLL